MLVEAGVQVFVNTRVAGAIMDGPRVRGAIVESRAGREAFYARSFVDCTAYGDLAAEAGAKYTEPNDYPVCNSVGIGNVDIDKYHEFFRANELSRQLARGMRSGQPDLIIRAGADRSQIEIPGLAQAARAIGMSFITTTVHDNYFMFIKSNLRLPVSPTDRDEVSKAELEIRRRMARAVELFREYIPGCEKAFMARTSPSLCIRRGRCIECDYDITHEDVIEARHFDDQLMVYGFHDMAPRLQIQGGGTYGVPYRALCVKGIENLFACGMMITSDHRAHMSTRNTVCCMGQGQGAGTAANVFNIVPRSVFGGKGQGIITRVFALTVLVAFIAATSSYGQERYSSEGIWTYDFPGGEQFSSPDYEVTVEYDGQQHPSFVHYSYGLNEYQRYDLIGGTLVPSKEPANYAGRRCTDSHPSHPPKRNTPVLMVLLVKI